MPILKRLLRLQKADKWLLFEATSTIVIVRILLRCFPLPTIQRAVLELCIRWRSHNRCAPDRIVWAITKTGSIAGSGCLEQALAARALLVRYGYKPRLSIGVAKDEQLQLEAHAWVTNEDQILIGGHESGRYTTLLTIGS
jgi:Transglutaminase-like superfamily